MKARQIILAVVLLAIGVIFGRYAWPNCPAIVPIAGTVSAEVVARGMTETPPDTIYVPVPVPVPGPERLVPGPERIIYSTAVQPVAPEVAPVDSVPPGPQRDNAIAAALLDWNTKRSYRGVLFDNPLAGKATYAFDVQFNRAGQITYQFTPALISIPKTKRWGVGIQAGYGASMQAGKVVGYPYIGVGVSYDLIRW